MIHFESMPPRVGRGRCANTFLVGGLLVDPADIEYIDGPIRAILLTHWHWDHTRGVQSLAKKLNLPVWAPEAPEGS